MKITALTQLTEHTSRNWIITFYQPVYFLMFVVIWLNFFGGQFIISHIYFHTRYSLAIDNFERYVLILMKLFGPECSYFVLHMNKKRKKFNNKNGIINIYWMGFGFASDSVRIFFMRVLVSIVYGERKRLSYHLETAVRMTWNRMWFRNLYSN